MVSSMKVSKKLFVTDHAVSRFLERFPENRGVSYDDLIFLITSLVKSADWRERRKRYGKREILHHHRGRGITLVQVGLGIVTCYPRRRDPNPDATRKAKWHAKIRGSKQEHL